MKHTKHISRGIFLILLYVMISLLCTFPAILHSTTRLIGDGWDNFEFYGFQYITSQNLLHGQHPFAPTTLFRYPVGINFGSSFDGVLPVLLGAMLIPILGQILAFNVTIIVIMTINGLCAHTLFRWISKSDRLAFFGSCIYAYSSYALARGASHANLLGIGGFALGVYAVLKLRQSYRHRTDYGMLCLALFLITISSLQYVLIAAVFMVSMGVMYTFYSSRVLKEYWHVLTTHRSMVIRTSLVFGCIVFYLFFPYIFGVLTGQIELSSRHELLTEYQPHLLNFFIPNPYITTFVSKIISAYPASIEQVIFIGFIEFLLFGWFVWKEKFSKASFPILIPFGIFFLLATGVGYAVIGRIFPFSVISEPARFFVIFYLLMTIAIIEGLKKSKTLQSPWILAVVLFCIGMERIGFAYPLSSIPTGPYTEVVAKQPGSAVFDIPVDPYNPLYDLLPSQYGKSITNGYIHWTGDTTKARSFLDLPEVTRFRCYPDTADLSQHQSHIDPAAEQMLNTTLFTTLKERDIKTIVVHLDRKFYDTVCDDMRNRTNILLPKMDTAISGDLQTIQFHLSDISYFYSEIYFPYDGVFRSDGMLIAPGDMLPLSEVLDSQDITFSQEDWENSQYGMIWKPKNPVSFPVRAGTTLKITSPRIHNGTGWMTYWYQYTISDATQPAVKPALEELYRDDKKVVYQLNY